MDITVKNTRHKIEPFLVVPVPKFFPDLDQFQLIIRTVFRKGNFLYQNLKHLQFNKCFQTLKEAIENKIGKTFL